MKLAYRDIEPFVANPNPSARVILVYGPDHGLMRERAQTMAKTVVEDINDPFNVITASGDEFVSDPERLAHEAHAPSMMGGQKLIRIENAGDKLTTLIKKYLEDASDAALVIIEAGELSPRSSLRKACESAKNAAAVPCYVEDERDLSRFIRGALQSDNLNIENDAVSWLAANIAGDRQKVRSELEKLIVYKGRETSPISLDDVQACCGTGGDVALDDLIYATAGNNTQAALQHFQKLNQEGVAFISIIRGLQSHFQKLHRTAQAIQNGQNLESAMKALSPPIFFKQQSAFKAQIQRWSISGIQKVLLKLQELETSCKQTNMPAETLCMQAILGISKSR